MSRRVLFWFLLLGASPTWTETGERQVPLVVTSSWMISGDRAEWAVPEPGVIGAPRGLDRTEEALAFLPGEQVADGRLRIKYRMTAWPHYIQAKLIFRSLDSRRFYMVSAFSMATDMAFTKDEGLMGLALLRGETSGHRRVLRYVPYLPWKPGYWYELRVDLEGPLIRVSLYSELEKRYKPLIRVRDDAYSSGAVGLGASGPVEFKELQIAAPAEPDRAEWRWIAEKPYWRAWTDGAERGSMPKLARLQNGTLLLAASELYFRPGPVPQVFIFESKDNGRSWTRISALQVGYAGVPFCKDDSVYLLDSYVKEKGGSIRRLTREEIEAQEPFQFVPHLRRSGDGGKSWSPPEALSILGMPTLPTQEQSVNLFVPPRVLEDGSWLLPVFTVARKPYPAVAESYILKSVDHGRSWRASPIDRNHEDASETDVIELEPGHVLAAMRTNFYTGFHGEAHSYDGGRTWRPVRLGAIPGSSSGPRFLKTRSGILLCMHRMIGTMISHSADLGKSWTTYQIDHPIEVMGDLLELPDGRVLIVYSAGGWGGIPRLQYLGVSREGISPLH